MLVILIVLGLAVWIGTASMWLSSRARVGELEASLEVIREYANKLKLDKEKLLAKLAKAETLLNGPASKSKSCTS